MEYVPGHNLRDVLIQHPHGMPDIDVQKWFLSICAGVCYLHDRGIVHRDLKPGNIFYDNDEQLVKIGDYGLSKYISHSAGSGHTESVGTFHYMAPEIGRGIYGKGIDIYALGIVLFEMLTGELPFDGESSQEIIMKHLMASPPLDLVPVAFRNAIENSLAKDSEARYANVRELLADLPWDEAKRAADNAARHATHVPPAPGCEQPTGPMPNSGSTAGSTTELPAGFGNDGVVYIDEDGVHESGILLGAVTDRLSAGFDLRHTAEPVSVRGGSGESQSRHGKGHISNEPVARVVTSGTVGLWNWFQNAPLATPVKFAIATGVGLVLLINSSWLLPVTLGLGLLYLIYFAIRSWMFTEDHAVTPTQLSKRAVKIQTETVLRSSMAMHPWTDRAIDLLGSMLVATISTIVIGLLCLAAGGGLFDPGIESWARYAWLATTATFGSWAILVAGKSWEHRVGDAWQRRIFMAGIGLTVGAISFGLCQFLLINNTGVAVNSAVAPDGVVGRLPGLAGNLVVFTALFGILRWWRLADPMRSTRLSLWSTGLCVVMAVVLSGTVELEPVWPAMLALMISTAVQIAAPWIPANDRRRAQQISVAHTA
jgi:hypothetical protein